VTGAISLLTQVRKALDFSINEPAKPLGKCWPEGRRHITREPGIAPPPAQTGKPTATPIEGDPDAFDRQHESLHRIEPVRLLNTVCSQAANSIWADPISVPDSSWFPEAYDDSLAAGLWLTKFYRSDYGTDLCLH